MQNKNLDFLGIGLIKCGTSWLYENLNQLDEFSLPPVKEMHYFNRSKEYPTVNDLSETLLINRIKSRSYLKNAALKIAKSINEKDWIHTKFYFKWFFSNYSDEWYLSLFKDFEGYSGEGSPSYALISRKDIKKMYELLPELKLVLLLRNPVHRTWSNYRNRVRRIKNFSIDNIEEKTITDFIESEKQIMISDYKRNLENYLSVFPKEQILIGFYDAILDNPEALFSKIVAFITEDKSITTAHIDVQKVVNKSPLIECPKNIETYIKEKHYNMIKELAECYGGYFNKWLEDTYGEKSSNENAISLTLSL